MRAMLLASIALIGAAIFSNAAFADNTEWTNPEPVTIYDYSGPAQDPFIAPNSPIMLFDSHSNDLTIPSEIFQAYQWDYKTFLNLGMVQGLDPGIKSNPNIDADGNFYWWTEYFYPFQNLMTSYRGKFEDGMVTELSPVFGISRQQYLWLTQSPEISGDGSILLFGDFRVDTIGVDAKPISSALTLAMKNSNGSFTQSPFSSRILASINNACPIVYNGRMSNDGLELYFTGVVNLAAGSQIYVAKRASTAVPFDTPAVISIAGQRVENGSLSRDGKHLYYHQMLGTMNADSQIYVLTRP